MKEEKIETGKELNYQENSPGMINDCNNLPIDIEKMKKEECMPLREKKPAESTSQMNDRKKEDDQAQEEFTCPKDSFEKSSPVSSKVITETIFNLTQPKIGTPTRGEKRKITEYFPKLPLPREVLENKTKHPQNSTKPTKARNEWSSPRRSQACLKTKRINVDPRQRSGPLDQYLKSIKEPAEKSNSQLNLRSTILQQELIRTKEAAPFPSQEIGRS